MTETAGARPPATTDSETSSWRNPLTERWRSPIVGRPPKVGPFSPYPARPATPELLAWARQLLDDPCGEGHHACRWCGGTWNEHPAKGQLGYAFPGPAEYCNHSGAAHQCESCRQLFVMFPPGPPRPVPCERNHTCRWCGGTWHVMANGRVAYSLPELAADCDHACACGGRYTIGRPAPVAIDEPGQLPWTPPPPYDPDECNGSCPSCCDG